MSERSGQALGPAEEEATGSTELEGPSHGRPSVRKTIPLVGLAVAVWAMLAPYIGPELAIDPQVEVVDHVVPGVVVLGLAAAGVAITRRPLGGATFLLVSGFGVTLAGIWMVATHLPLVAQGMRDEVAWLPVIHHSLPGFAVAGLGLLWTAAHWSEAPS